MSERPSLGDREFIPPPGGAASSSGHAGGVGAFRPSPLTALFQEPRPDVESLGRHRGMIQMPKPWKSQHKYASQDIIDLVCLATQAQNHGVGQLVWYSYNGTDSASHLRKPQLGFGMSFAASRAWGARADRRGRQNSRFFSFCPASSFTSPPTPRLPLRPTPPHLRPSPSHPTLHCPSWWRHGPETGA